MKRAKWHLGMRELQRFSFLLLRTYRFIHLILLRRYPITKQTPRHHVRGLQSNEDTRFCKHFITAFYQERITDCSLIHLTGVENCQSVPRAGS